MNVFILIDYKEHQKIVLNLNPVNTYSLLYNTKCITSFSRLGASGLVMKAVPFTTTAVSSTNTLQIDKKIITNE